MGKIFEVLCIALWLSMSYLQPDWKYRSIGLYAGVSHFLLMSLSAIGKLLQEKQNKAKYIHQKTWVVGKSEFQFKYIQFEIPEGYPNIMPLIYLATCSYIHLWWLIPSSRIQKKIPLHEVIVNFLLVANTSPMLLHWIVFTSSCLKQTESLDSSL